MFQYDPKDARECLDAGTYDAVLETVDEETSKKGNPMLKVKWDVFTGERHFTITDYIVNPATLFKMKRIAKCFGLSSDFEDGIFDISHCIGRPLKLVLELKNDPQYGDQNNVKSYESVAAVAGQASNKNGNGKKPASPAGDRDIPF